MIVPDVNLLSYAINRNNPFHDQARAGTPTVQMVPAARERRPPVGTAARSAANGVFTQL